MKPKTKTPPKYKQNKNLKKLNDLVELRLKDVWHDAELPLAGPSQLTATHYELLFKLVSIKNLYNLEALAVENARQIEFLENLIQQWQEAQQKIVEQYTEHLNKSEKKFTDERAVRNEVVRTYNNFVNFGQLGKSEDIKAWNKDLPEGLRGSHTKYEIRTKLLESGKTSTSIKEKKKPKEKK